jgi:iron-sulfur cluster repair protein YtfE (RIC family)
MFNFTQFVQSSDTVRDVVRRYPQTREVFEEAGIRLCCFDCAIRTAALRGGIELSGLMHELDQAVFGCLNQSPAC